MSETERIKINFVVVGDYGTGKTCLSHHFANDTALADSQPTIGLDLHLRDIDDARHGPLRFLIHDTAGGEQFQRQSLVQSFYNGKEAVLFVFDVTRRDTYDHVREGWYDRVVSAKSRLRSGWLSILVGNKSDLVERGVAARAVPVDEAEATARLLDMEGYVELSALHSARDQISFPFLTLAHRLIEAGVVKPARDEPLLEMRRPADSCCGSF